MKEHEWELEMIINMPDVPGRKGSGMLYIFHGIEGYSDEEYMSDLRLVPEERRKKALEYHFIADRKRCIKAYMLLREGLKREYGMTQVPDLVFGEYGKPFLKGCSDIYFSLSHSGSSVMCVIDSVPVGADIEEDIDDMELMKSICRPDEIRIIENSDKPENAFAACFTAKESCAKLRGTGLIDIEDTKSLPSQDNEEFVFEKKSVPDKGFSYSICRYRKDQSLE